MPNKLLSKSKYMNGLQCLKYLWLLFNDPQQVPGPDASTQRIFDQGHLVGELAKQLYPGGVDVPHADFKDNLRLTKELLATRLPLFEPGFFQDGLFSRLDILNPVAGDAWDIIEVKSSTSLKDENLHDISFQRHCCEKTGLKVNRCYLAVINNQYVKKGEIDPVGFFTLRDVTEQVDQVAEGIEDRIKAMQTVIASASCPEVRIGQCCNAPYDCPVLLCRQGLPQNNIFDLYRGGQKCYQLYYDGILTVADIPDGYKLNRSQQIQKTCEMNGLPHIDKSALKEFLAKIQAPVYYLDFETISPAIPLFDGMRPYQRIPFQYSLHVAGIPETRHSAFLAAGRNDPRPQLLRRLKKALGTTGSILTYNQSFEEGCLREMAQAFPEYAGWVDQICARMLDLLKPFQSFSYYHPAQRGSASIKHVMPAITGRGYDGLAIANGDAASGAYLAVTYGQATSEERRQVYADLEKYCGRDTEGMIWIVEKLKDICKQNLV
jgi:hypothetical protein